MADTWILRYWPAEVVAFHLPVAMTSRRSAHKIAAIDVEVAYVTAYDATRIAVTAHVLGNNLSRTDLLFGFPLIESDGGQPHRGAEETEQPTGRTEPDQRGRTYEHGTLTAYTLGTWRCPHCKTAFATYRADRRAAGKDDPRGTRIVHSDGHIPRRWFRHHIWTPATTGTGLTFTVRFHDLRHAHASWLLAGGADIQTVKERLGHGSLRTTEKYLHTLPDHDNTALNALHRTRTQKENEPSPGPR